MIYLGDQIVSMHAFVGKKDDESQISGTDVKFIDYDGTLLTSYSAAEASALTAMPALPSHEGLSAQGWNYTLAQMKACISAIGTCDVGCMCTTDDGKTRITLTIQSAKYSNIPLVFKQTIANGVEIDWGDESAIQTYSSTSQLTATHQYSSQEYPATYTIAFNVVNGTMSFPSYILGKSGSSSSASNPIIAWNNMIDSINIGNAVTSIGSNAFYYCGSLTSIAIPSSVTSIRSSTFRCCYSLKSMTIPSLVTSIESNAFNNCNSLTSIAIPSSVTSIGSSAFNNCYSLKSISIPSSVTSIGSSAFKYCYAFASMTIPFSVTTIDSSVFYNCCSFASIIIPSSITSIGSYAFYNCYSLASMTIPSSVTTIDSYAFNNCHGLRTFDFRAFTSIPTLSDVNAFQNTSSNKEIIVPDELYDDWKSASNWSSTSNNIVSSIVKASESTLGPLR